jgi:hypothetical protein
MQTALTGQFARVLDFMRVKYGHESRGARNQDSLCWHGPAAIYPTEFVMSHESEVEGWSQQLLLHSLELHC